MFTWAVFEAGCAQSAWGGVGWRGWETERERERKASWQLGQMQSNLERVRPSAAPTPGGNMEIML